MPPFAGLDCTSFLRTVARGVKSCRWFDNRHYLKLDHRSCTFPLSAKAQSTMTSVNEGKRSAAYFAVDEYIRVYVVTFRIRSLLDTAYNVFCKKIMLTRYV